VRLLWNLTLCNVVERNQRFEETCYFGFRVYSKDNRPHRVKRFFFSAKRSDGLWHPPKLLFQRYRGLIPCEKSGRGVKLTTLLHLVPRLRMSKVHLHSPIPYAFMTCTGKTILQQVAPIRSRTPNKLPYSLTFQDSYIQLNL
jgi:hypothetical protein